MTFLIDRRSNPKQKSAVNRQRFLRRYKDQIKQSVTKNLRGRRITEDGKGKVLGLSAVSPRDKRCEYTPPPPGYTGFRVVEN